jgi:UPF0042 nucleotide-binding protein
MKQRNVIILTGCSGSGKSTALATFEDAGFYCIDNMPARLVRVFLEQARQEVGHMAGWAFVMDIRDKHFLPSYGELCHQLEKDGYQVSLVYLHTDEQTLVRRYSQTRRHHPLGTAGSLIEAIRKEKQQIQTLENQAHHIIDTSHFTVHDLKFAIRNVAQKHTAISGMSVCVVSFGFKHGAPQDADMMMDVRFLANPYFIPELNQKNGESKEIREFVLQDEKTGTFITKYLDLLDYLIPLYEKEGKAYLTVAIGCTGGVHRSVVIAQEVYNHLRLRSNPIRLIHRDIRLQQ